MGYNSVATLLGGSIFAVCACVVGVFLLARREELISDVLAHATLPGLVGGFLLALVFGHSSGRSTPLLLLGACCTALLCQVLYHRLRAVSYFSADAIMAVLLAFWFGLGALGLNLIQSLPTAGRAGLSDFLLGSAAAMTMQDVAWNAVIAVVVLITMALIWRDLRVASFDRSFAITSGINAGKIDLLLGLCVLATVAIGLHAVGLVLSIGLLLLPAAIARLWAHRISSIYLIAIPLAIVGVGGGIVLSLSASNLPTGAAIVAVLATMLVAGVIAKALWVHRSRREG